MSYRVEFSRSAERELSKLAPDARQRILRSVVTLADNPRPVGVKKIVGETDAWRLRVGEYRVIYRVDGDELLVLVVRVGHRREVYRGA